MSKVEGPAHLLVLKSHSKIERSWSAIWQVPATINRYLRDYQREGVRFLYQHFVQDGGAILGDDMGLGKTVQVG